MVITRLGNGGYAVHLHGDFSGKPEFTPPEPSMIITKLGTGGYGVHIRGDFSGKTVYVPALPPRNVEYLPGPVPYDLQGHTRFLQDELFKVADVLRILSSGFIQEVSVEPVRPRTGDQVLADGVNFDPGAGQGVYCYYNNTWNKLG